MVWSYGMAIMTIRSTYALDVETVRKLERLSRKWGVSKSEALRRSIQSAAASGGTEAADKLQALDEFQRSVRLSKHALRKWQNDVRAMRRDSSKARGLRWK